MGTPGKSETPASDDTLVARVAAGDALACRELAERHLGRIVSFGYRMLGNRDDAEDVAQEVFVRLWTHAARWQPGGARLSTWLHRVAFNLCRDHRARARERPLESAADPPDPRPSPVMMLHERDIACHVGTALESLPERQRAAIALCHYQGLGNIEAAEVMEISVDALESLLARGRRGLRARLAGVAAGLLGDG
jgi:RNA polymerase sigma-70 factor (ECF subfamily)